MTEAGLEALKRVMDGRKVAVQFVSMLPYLMEGRFLTDDDWQPIVLIPARAANLRGPKWLMRGSEVLASMALERSDWRPLTPGAVGATADRFSL
jgi:hypothetical protein